MKRLAILVAIAMVLCPAAFAATWYVDLNNSSGSEDGTTWGTAFVTIQDGINAASGGDEVIVAEGTYVENIEFNGDDIILRSTDPADASVVANTVIDGGGAGSVVMFYGTESTDCVLAGFTITNGNAVGAGGGGIQGFNPNLTLDTLTLATIRNNTITGNTAVKFGGGLFGCLGAIQNNTIAGNMAEQGGGLYGCFGTIRNNAITGNAAEHGGGLYWCSGTIQNNTITGNSANAADGTGGGIAWSGGFIINCIVWGNSALGEGDQLYESSIPFYSCIQDWAGGGAGNISTDPGLSGDNHLGLGSPCIDTGNMYYLDQEHVADIDGECRVAGSSVDIGSDEYGSSPDSDYDLLADSDEAAQGGYPDNPDTDGDGLVDGIEVLRGTEPNVVDAPSGISVPAQYTSIQQGIWLSFPLETITISPDTYTENLHLLGKNIVLQGSNPFDDAVVAGTILDGDALFSVISFAGTEDESCVVRGLTITNGGGFLGGGIYGNGARATIENNMIVGNSVVDAGGGLYWCEGTIQSNIIADNFADFKGGGFDTCNGTIQNNIISDNSATEDGGGLYFCNGTIRNNTIRGNSANYGGGFSNCGDAGIRNCIIWANTAAVGGDQLYSSATPTYSCIQDWTGGGTGNITSDPLLADPDNDDYHLLSGSPCIDAGGLAEGLTEDIDAEMRPFDGVVEARGDGSDYDIGADEYVESGSAPANLDVSTNIITVVENSPSATFDILNLGDLALSWAVESDTASVTADLASGTGETTITVTASDFSEDITADITVTNTENAADVEIVVVNVQRAVPPSDLEVSTNLLTLSEVSTSDTFDILNLGELPLSWEVASDTPSVTVDVATGAGEATITVTGSDFSEDITANVTATNAGDPADVETVVVEVHGTPLPSDLEVSTNLLTLSEDSPSATFDILNAGDLPLNWTAASDTAGVAVDIGSGTGETTITVTASDFDEDITANVTATNTDEPTDTETVVVNVDRTIPPSDLDVSTNVLNLSESSPSATFNILNVGELPLNWTVASDTASVTVDLGSGTGETTITVTASDFTEDIAANVTVTNTDDPTDVETVVANVERSPLPGDLDVSTNLLTLTESSPSATFNILNLGELPLNWTVASDTGSVTVDLANGTDEATITVTASDFSEDIAANVTVTNTGNPSDVEVVVVNVQRTIPPSDLEVSTNLLTLTESSPPPTFNILNLGELPLNWTVASDTASVTVDIASGTGETTIAVTATDFSEDIAANLTVTNTDNPTDVEVVVVNVQRTIPPSDLEVSTNMLTLTESSPSATFNILNVGELPLNWTVASDTGSVAVDVGSGTGETTITVTASDFTENIAANLTVTNTDNPSDTETVVVSVQRTIPPSDLDVSTNMLTLSESFPAATFNILNLGELTLNWTVASDTPSVTIDLASGTDEVTITVTASDFAEDITANLTVTNTDNPSDTETVVVNVQRAIPPSDLEVSTNMLTLSESFPSATFNILNLGELPLNWTVSSDTGSVTVDLASGTDEVTITVTASDFAENITANLTVTNTDNPTDTETVVVNVQRAIPPSDLEVSTNVLTLTDSFPSATFNILNLGELPLSWTVASDTPSVTVDLASGTDEVTITVTASDFTENITANLTVTNTGNPSDTETVVVQVQRTLLPSDLEVSTNVLTLTDSFPSATFNILNLGELPLNWTVASDTPSVTVDLASGTDEATITVTASDFTADITANVTVTNTDDPTDTETVVVHVQRTLLPSDLDVSTNLLTLTESFPSTAFNIMKSGDLPLNWTVASNTPSVTVDLASGTGEATITVTASGFTEDITANVTVVNADSPTDTETVVVHVQRTLLPSDLDVSTNFLTLTESFPSATFIIIKSGDLPLNWTVASDTPSVTPDLASGIGEATITVTASDFTEDITANLTVTNSDDPGDTETVVVQVKRTLLPGDLVVSTNALALTESSPSATFNVLNSGEQPLSWTVASDTASVTVDIGSSTGEATITVTGSDFTEDISATLTVTNTGNPSDVETVLVQVQRTLLPSDLDVSTNVLTLTDNFSSAAFNILKSGDLPLNWTVASDTPSVTVDLASGTGEATITVTASDFTDDVTANVTVTNTADPADTETVVVQVRRTLLPSDLEVSTNMLTLTEKSSSATFNILNSGDLPLNWTVESDTASVTVDLASGTGETTITVTASDFSEDITANVTVTNTDDPGDTETVVVEVRGTLLPSNLAVSTNLLTLTESFSSATFNILKSGDLPLNWTVTSDTASVTVDLAGGAGEATVTVTASDFSQDVTANVTVTNTDDPTDTETVVVHVQRALRPGDVAVSTNMLTLTESSPSATVNILNVGELPLSWTVASDTASVTVDLASGTGQATITVTASDFGQDVTANLTVTNTGDPADTETVVVQVRRTFLPSDLEVSTNMLTLTEKSSSATFNILNSGDLPLSWTVESDTASVTVSLATGTGQATITVTASNFTEDITANVTVTNTGNPNDTETVVVDVQRTVLPGDMDVSTNLLTLTERSPSATFNILKSGDLPLNWTVESDTPSVTVDLESGTGQATIAVTASDFTDDITANLTVTNTGNPSDTETVVVQVQRALLPGDLAVSTTLLTLTENSPSASFNILNSGELPLSWTIESDTPSVTVDIDSGTNHARITVTASDFARNITATLTVANSNDPSDTETVVVHVQRTPLAGDLGVSTNLLTLMERAPSATFNILNSGEMPLSWTIESDTPSVTVDLSSGTGEATITVTASDFSQVLTANLTVTNLDDPSDTETVVVRVGQAPRTDVNRDGTVNAIDVQLVINAALGLLVDYDCDVDEDGTVNAIDVQLVINAALGI